MMDAVSKTGVVHLMPRMAGIKDIVASKATPFSYYALRKMCLEGRVAHVRVSGKFYINLDDLARLMNGGRTDET